MIETYLKLLECDAHSSLDDVKAAFRELAIKYHPDTSRCADASMFRAVNEAYEYLKKHHKPSPKLKDTKGLTKFFRLIDKAYDGELAIKLPVASLEEDTVIICMWRDKEFNIHLEKGTTFPKTIEIKNIMRHPVRMTIYPDV